LVSTYGSFTIEFLGIFAEAWKGVEKDAVLGQCALDLEMFHAKQALGDQVDLIDMDGYRRSHQKK
jgi:hypothetical protein